LNEGAAGYVGNARQLIVQPSGFLQRSLTAFLEGHEKGGGKGTGQLSFVGTSGTGPSLQ